MLKIKSNIKEFTIIFLRRFERKNECKRISFSLYQLQRLLSTSTPLFLLLFSSLVSAPSPPFSFQRLLFFFFWCVALFQPKCWAQNIFQFSPTLFFFLFYSVFSSPFLFQIWRKWRFTQIKRREAAEKGFELNTWLKKGNT